MGDSIIKAGTASGFPVDPLKISLPADGTCFVGEFSGKGEDWSMKHFSQNNKPTLAEIPKPSGEIIAVIVTIHKGALYYCAESTKGQWICTTK